MDITEIIHRIQRDDSEAAFRSLFDSQYERMFRIAYYFLQNDDLAQETALDVLASIWEKRKTMIVPHDFRHFSFVMVKNAAINKLQKEQHAAGFWDDAPLEQTPQHPNADATSSTPHELLEQAELFERYEQLLDALPPRCRQVFQCIKEDGLSYAQTAQELGISTKTVDAQLQKALQFLRAGLQPYATQKWSKRFFSLFL